MNGESLYVTIPMLGKIFILTLNEVFDKALSTGLFGRMIYLLKA